MSTPETLRWWADLIRKSTKEFYFSHVLVADLNYGADEIEKLESENAKLRELVSGLEYCAQGSVCDCCPLYDPSGTNHRRCESLERELGIEAGE